ncbi:MAG: hypothetical protein OXR68_01265 [Alphaproteobacteria bacterium]|nr:hypothetical protein [Alphaproteobacteria bacterium]MDD9919240.1 hypothetical protein [Alphaproteobacteria bacterium]
MTSFFRGLIYIALIAGVIVLIQNTMDEPGTVVMTWYGYEITTSMAFIVAAFNIALIMAFYVGRLVAFVLDIPNRLRSYASHRQDRKALALLAQGVDALTAGDGKHQERLALQLTKALPNEELAITLAAHLNPTAERLHLLLAKPETAFMGHVGLLREAAARDDWAGVKFHAEAALKKRANSPIVQKQLFEAHLHTGQFEKSLSLLPKLRKAEALGSKAMLVEAAVYLHVAIAEKANNPTTALRQAQSAQKACPHFVPAALFRASTLLGLGKTAPAERVLSEFWHTCPRYDVYQKWWQTIKGESPNMANDKLWKKVSQMLEPKLSHPDEGHIAALCAGDAAMELNDPERARDMFMKAFRQSANKTVLRKLALLEQRMGDEAAASDWLLQAMEAPELAQPGDKVLAAYQEFRQQYGLDGKTSNAGLESTSTTQAKLLAG